MADIFGEFLGRFQSDDNHCYKSDNSKINVTTRVTTMTTRVATMTKRVTTITTTRKLASKVFN